MSCKYVVDQHEVLACSIPGLDIMMEKSEYCDSLMGRLYNATKAGDIAMVQEIFGDKCRKELDDSYTQQVVSAAIT